MRSLLVALALALGASATVPAASPASAAGTRGADQSSRVVTRDVVFDVVNTPDRAEGCQVVADGEVHQVHGTLVGPARVLRRDVAAPTVNVLVHDAGTGGWFWRASGAQDYAGALARAGQTSLVIDRLGYDRSRLDDGAATCLGAQAAMLHQVVQRLYSGRYRMADAGASTVHAGRVVVHGHGTGATIAQLESQSFADVAGLVLLSPVTGRPSRLAGEVIGAQSMTCARGAGYAPFGATRAIFDRLLFASAPTAVRERASRLRNPTPCGDVATLAASVAAAGTGGATDADVLVLRGSEDARSEGSAVVSTEGRLVRRTIAGAGNSLVLERQAPQVQRQVLGFLDGLDPRGR